MLEKQSLYEPDHPSFGTAERRIRCFGHERLRRRFTSLSKSKSPSSTIIASATLFLAESASYYLKTAMLSHSKVIKGSARAYFSEKRFI